MTRERVCAGAAHVDGCEHALTMQQGVERFLAHPRTREVVTLYMAHMPVPMMDPRDAAIGLLTEMARAYELLDGLDVPNVEPLTDDDVDALGEVASYLEAVLAGTETRA